MIKFGYSLVSLKSNKQDVVSRSSTESEYRSMASTVAELTRLQGLVKEIGSKVTQQIKVSSDSKSTLQIAINSIYHERTKHLKIDYHFTREKI